MPTQPMLARSLMILALFASVTCAATTKDFTGQELDGKSFQDGGLNGATFDKASLKSANFRNATCKNASFRDAKLQGANFTDANLEGADFTGAELKHAKFHNAKLWHAKLSWAEIDLLGAVPINFNKIDDFRARETAMANRDKDNGALSFHYADLHKSIIIGDAVGVDFRDANLCGADLSKATNLDKARLDRVTYDEKTKWSVDPKAAGAILVAAAAPDALAPAAATRPVHPLVGTWLILKEEGDAPDNGRLQILGDGTFDWDPTFMAKSQPVTGKWSARDDAIEIVGGESGQTWKASKVVKNGKPELHLENAKGTRRLAIPLDPIPNPAP